jgi:hypothetical protein
MKNIINQKNLNFMLNFSIKRLAKFSTKSNDDKVSYVKVNMNDIKNFGKKFSDEEKKKYLDPFGFLNSNECKKLLN